MVVSETTSLLQKKFLKIFIFLILIRLGLYIPIPNIDLNIFSQNQTGNSLFGLTKSLTGSTFLGIGSLGILPYINSSIVIQLLTPIIPSLERLQKEEGELGRKQIIKYTRYLTLAWALVLSTGVAFLLIKPVIFNWSILLALKIIFALTTGSMLSMWFAELITKEDLGNGSSMIIFINIIGGIPANFTGFNSYLGVASANNNIPVQFLIAISIYFIVVALVVLVQDSYKRINVISAKQLNSNYFDQTSNISKVKSSFIPLKLNQGGIMPLVFSTTIVGLLFYPLQFLLTTVFRLDGEILKNLLTLSSVSLNLILVIFFSIFYSLLILKPNNLSDDLTKMAYTVPGFRQGKDTIRYLEQIISRLAFIGGIFLGFLTFFPLVLENVFQFSLFKNLTSLIILIGVITDVTSQVEGFLVSKKYEGFKKT